MTFYPLYIYYEDGRAYGGVFPDIAGCFVGVDKLEELNNAAQEAFKAHFDFDNDPIPKPTVINDWLHHPDFTNGFWMMININLSEIRNKSTRLNISLPFNLVQQIDEIASRQSLSRSAFIANATSKAIKNTEQLNY